MTDFKEMNEIYQSYFTSGKYPARLTIQSLLPGRDFLVEIDCVAALQERYGAGARRVVARALVDEHG